MSELDADSEFPSNRARFDDVFHVDKPGHPVHLFRLTWLYPFEIKNEGRVMLCPHLGTVAFNILPLEKIDVVHNKVKPQVINGCHCKDRVDFVLEGGEKPEKHIIHSYLIEETHKWRFPLLEIVYEAEYNYTEFVRRKPTGPSWIEKKAPNQSSALSQNIIHFRVNHEEVGRKLISRQFPKLLLLMEKAKSGHPPTNNEIAEALYLDFRLQEIVDVNLPILHEAIKSNDFVAKLNEVVSGKSPIDRLELLLHRGWLVDNFYKLSADELTKVIKRRLGRNVKPNTLTQKISRLGLQRATINGRPPNFSPPVEPEKTVQPKRA